MQLSNWQAPNGQFYHMPTAFVINLATAPGNMRTVVINAFNSYQRTWSQYNHDKVVYGQATANRLCQQANQSWLRVQDCVIRNHWAGLA